MGDIVRALLCRVCAALYNPGISSAKETRMTFDQYETVFLSHVSSAANRIYDGKRLVHYTNADAANKIITGNEIWLRNAVLMNDFLELRYGLECLQSAWQTEAGNLRIWLEEHWLGLYQEIEADFNLNLRETLNSTFILSLSEHEDEEDNLGRLSMWRAYGGTTGVALVVNPTVFSSHTDLMGVYSLPVIYCSKTEFVERFRGWTDKIIHSDFTSKNVDRITLKFYFLYAFRTFVLGTKHPGFAEEKEWRIFHTVGIDEKTRWLDYSIETINGIPQQIVKVNLMDAVDEGLVGVSPKTLLNRVIVGPCEHPIPIGRALIHAMEEANVEEPEDKISLSEIPLRQRQ